MSSLTPSAPLNPPLSPTQKSPPRPQVHKAPSQNRLPPPALFQAPPSPNTSTLDLPSLAQTHTNPHPQNPKPPSSVPTKPTVPSYSSFAPVPSTVEEQPVLHQWSEMQRALLKPEQDTEQTSARGVGVGHVFGLAHGAALERLREAQVRLAGAWRSGEVDVDTPAETGREDGGGGGGGSRGDGKGERDGDGDAEVRGRRKANDVYFEDVNRRVGEVVTVLGEVEGAMRGVEREGREIWREKDKDKERG